MTSRLVQQLVRLILRRSMNTEDKLTVVYQSNSKLFIAIIDLPQRQVATKDLPAVPWPLAAVTRQPPFITGEHL